jgi:hypothetical protein
MGWSFDDLSLYYVLHLGKGSLGEINRAWQVLPANGKKMLLWEYEIISLGRLLGRVIDLFLTCWLGMDTCFPLCFCDPLVSQTPCLIDFQQDKGSH